MTKSREFHRPLLGGLNTKEPPTLLAPTVSPDLLNVVLTDSTTRKRGGFVPLFKDRMRANSVRNQAYTARAAAVSGGSATDYRYVPGSLLAGHRPIYEGLSAWTVEFFYEAPDELPTTAPLPGSGTTTLTVRPLLSKGPHKRSFDTAAPECGGVPAAVTNANTVWGNHTDSGLPFAIYLYNNGGTWEIRASFHAFIAGNWTLQTATSTVAVAPNRRYHIIAAFDTTRVSIRVAPIFQGETPSYTSNTTSFSAVAIGWNKCPIMVFDAPQRFIEDTNVGSGTQRPGLNLAAGIYTRCLRGEGRIEDIAIWSGDKTAVTASALDRQHKLDIEQAQDGLINYWDMLGGGTDYALDAAGRGNHLYFSPRGPVTDTTSGGKDGASWWFDGRSAYAIMAPDAALEHTRASPPVWRWLRDAAPTTGAMSYLVQNNLPYGMQVEFSVDSIDPVYEQVIAEIHGAIRLAINTNGTLVAYSRVGGTGVVYQLYVTGSTPIIPGRRYMVSVMRSSGTVLTIYLNDQVELTTSGGVPALNTSQPVGTITLGMGSYELMIQGANQTDSSIAYLHEQNTDNRSGFCGRIEAFKVLLSTVGVSRANLYRSLEGKDDWTFEEARPWQNRYNSTRSYVAPQQSSTTGTNDFINPEAVGALWAPEGHSIDGYQVGYAIIAAPAGTNYYQIHTDPFDNSVTSSGIYGHDNDVLSLGARVYHAIGVYRLTSDDGEVDQMGHHMLGMENRYNGATTTKSSHPTKATWAQGSSVADGTGFLPNLQKRCSEVDVLYETDATIYGFTGAVLPQRPELFRSPREIGPTWSSGIVTTLPGHAKVNLLAQFRSQTGNRRLTITGCGRQLYWAKPIWEADSPYGEADPASVAFPGGRGSFVKVNATASQLGLVGTASKTVVVFECWVKPQRLDGTRVIACKYTPSTPNQVNFAILTVDGSIELLGTEGGTRLWGYAEGVTGSTYVRRSQSLRVNAWNHLHVTIDTTTGVQLRVNGSIAPLFSRSGLTGSEDRDAIGGAASDATTANIYLGGVPDGRDRFSFPCVATGGNVSINVESWCGLMSDVRQNNAVNTTEWPTGLSGFPPRERLAVSGSTFLSLPMNEGEGWFLANSVSADHAHADIREFILIKEGLSDDTYRHIAFRDRLLITNGTSKPQQVQFSSVAARPPMSVYNLGLEAPTSIATVTAPATSGTSGITAGLYVIYVTFVTADGKESDPTLVGSHNQPSDVQVLNIKIANLPRSPDPQVVARNLYATPAGGGSNVVFYKQIGNDSTVADVRIDNLTGTGTVEAGNRLPAPKARLISVAGPTIVLADLPEEAAGQNAFAFSTADEPSYFTTSSTFLVDSEDGNPLTGLRGNLGQFFLSKRDSVWHLAVGSIVTATEIEANLKIGHQSDGIGGGNAVVGNLIYGAGDRGVFEFDNSNPNYLTRAIEPTWRDEVDRTDSGLRAMWGAYAKERSEYWLSSRDRGTLNNETIWVFQLTARAWTKLTVPEHCVMQAMQDPITQESQIAIGTTCGSILVYDDDEAIDGATLDFNSTLTVVVSGTSGTLTTTSLTLPGTDKFDEIGGGLAGATITVTLNGTDYTRRIVRSTQTQVFWTEPLASASGMTAWSIGGYEGYWTSPWFSVALPSEEQDLNEFDLEFLPRTGSVRADVASVRQGEAPVPEFPSSAFESFTIDMATGWQLGQNVLRSHQRGHYHRLRVYSTGPSTPWDLVGYALTIRPQIATGHTGRSS